METYTLRMPPGPDMYSHSKPHISEIDENNAGHIRLRVVRRLRKLAIEEIADFGEGTERVTVIRFDQVRFMVIWMRMKLNGRWMFDVNHHEIDVGITGTLAERCELTLSETADMVVCLLLGGNGDCIPEPVKLRQKRLPDEVPPDGATYTIAECALLMARSYSRVAQLAGEGKLPGAYKIGQLWYVDRKRFDTWLRERA